MAKEPPKIRPINISFKDTEKDKKLEQYIRNKAGYSAWVKDSLYKAMEKEINESAPSQPVARNMQRNFSNVPKVNDDIL
ncbi:MAG TPA: hypothetical protein VHQ24_15285 [Lachnospiraceae bacterium]|nr:hypothetical protein [Lachnospiraceae bacterium]